MASRLAGSGDRGEPPRFLPCLGIERDDEVAAGSAAGGADHHLAIRDKRPAGHAVTRLVVGHRLVPHHVSGLGVERDHVRVRGRHVQASAVQRDASLHSGILTARQPPRVLPEEIAGCGVERLHFVAVARGRTSRRRARAASLRSRRWAAPSSTRDAGRQRWLA